MRRIKGEQLKIRLPVSCQLWEDEDFVYLYHVDQGSFTLIGRFTPYADPIQLEELAWEYVYKEVKHG